MVAKIKSGKSLIGALNYNENKVKQGKAELLMASGYPKDHDQLSFYDKLYRLTDLAERNTRTKTNTLHISLNFATTEHLAPDKLKDIIENYMSRIGFGGQPYLAYQHFDAGHPHVHIVSTNIQAGGERISLHYLGQQYSEPARKAIETEFGLIKAEEQQQQQPQNNSLKPTHYGKSESKRAITNIVSEIIRTYKFTSIPELNAILNQYNITADRGAKDSRMFAKNGLVYWILDEKGNKAGVPIKASSIYGSPTLKKLETRFRLNEALRKPLKDSLKNKIDAVLQKPLSKTNFQQALQKQGIEVIFRQNEEGRIYGVTFVDQNNKAVFNGSDLGKTYSAALLTTQFRHNEKPTKTTPINRATLEPAEPATYNNDPGLLDILFQSEQQDIAALNKFKKKKRRRHNL